MLLSQHPAELTTEQNVAVCALCLRTPPPVGPFDLREYEIKHKEEQIGGGGNSGGTGGSVNHPTLILESNEKHPQAKFSTPSSNTSRHIRKPLKSALKQPSRTPKQPRTERLVRGLWNPHCFCLFSKLSNDILIDRVFTYLSLPDLVSSSKVCRRWRHGASHPHCWKTVSLTPSLLSRSDPESALSSMITQHQSHIRSLSLRDIEHTLPSQIATIAIGTCLSSGLLENLTLTAYATLTDRHVNLMLLAQHFNRSNLTSLQLEQCPLLGDMSLKSIAMHCPNLTSLSLRGCKGITDQGILELRGRIAALDSSKQSLQSLFAPGNRKMRNSAVNPSLSTVFSQKRLSGSTVVSSTSLISRHSSLSGKGGKLCSLDVSRTGVTPDGILKLLDSPPSSRLQCLKMGGSGESWTDSLLQQFWNRVNLADLQTLDISCANPFLGSGQVTDGGLSISSGCCLGLKTLNLSGHVKITGRGVANVLERCENLEDLDLGGCTGLIRGVDRFAEVLLKHASLKRLCLWRCFPNKKRTLSDSCLEKESCEWGSVLIGGICRSPSAASMLRILDLDNCYFVDSDMVKCLRDSCPMLEVLRLRGTRYWEERNE